MRLKSLNYTNIKNYITAVAQTGVYSNRIRIEASGACQLKCADCGHSIGGMETIGKGYLKIGDFKRFVDAYPSIRNIELSNYGEMFLNPDLKKIIEYAHMKNISLVAENGVNFNTASDDMIESLVRYHFKKMVVSIDGATNEIYKIYRVGGDLGKVLENIKKINRYKQRYNTAFPHLSWQFVIFGHNEHEIPLARRMAADLNMHFETKLNWSATYSPVKDKEFVRREAGPISEQEYERDSGRLYCWACCQLWNSPQINWDGRLLGCCCNKYSDFGNVFEEGLKECLNSERYIYAKKMVSGRAKEREDIPCFYCKTYKKMKSKNMYVNPAYCKVLFFL
ncbi:MAG: SPASM domain-containing protein [Candidatus Omnitrophica bacterium]|nr:SPASM domain-containing protein [Candidatus Omnitrophota bacterium]